MLFIVKGGYKIITAKVTLISSKRDSEPIVDLWMTCRKWGILIRFYNQWENIQIYMAIQMNIINSNIINIVGSKRREQRNFHKNKKKTRNFNSQRDR